MLFNGCEDIPEDIDSKSVFVILLRKVAVLYLLYKHVLIF